MGRQKLKKSFQYEIKWRGLDHKFNTWIPREELLEKGFQKIVSQFDDLEASREGAGQRETSAHVVRKHLEDIGLDGDIAQYNEIAGLSGGKPEIVTLLNSRLAVTSFGSQVRRLSSLSLRVYGITPRYVSLRIHRYPGRLKGGERYVYSMSQATSWTEKHSAVLLLQSGIGVGPWYAFIFLSLRLSSDVLKTRS